MLDYASAYRSSVHYNSYITESIIHLAHFMCIFLLSLSLSLSLLISLLPPSPPLILSHTYADCHSPTELNELDTSRSRGSSVDDQDEYIEVRPGGDISSDASSGEEEDGYLEMSPAPVM